LVLLSAAFGALKLYDVVPYRNCMGTQPLGQIGISQTFVNVVDSLTMVSVSVGDVGGGAAFDGLAAGA
jgi:hypothetical protein